MKQIEKDNPSEFEWTIEEASPRDGPELKSLIKRTIREELPNNPKLYHFLKEQKAEGKYIKAFTDRLLNNILKSYRDYNRDAVLKYINTEVSYNIHNSAPINSSFNWRSTPQGHSFWRELEERIQRIAK